MGAAHSAETEYLWLIENYSCYPGQNYRLCTPKLPSEGLEGTSWYLVLRPVELREEATGEGGLSVERAPFDDGPKTIWVRLDVSILKADGTVLYSEHCKSVPFPSGARLILKPLVDVEEIYARKNPDFLPLDTLIVRCRMWNLGGRSQKTKQFTIRTIVEMDKVSFEHKIKKFSKLKKNKKKTIQIPSRTQEGYIFSSTIWICKEESPEGSIIVDVKPLIRDHLIKSKKFSMIGVNGEIANYLDVDYRFDDADEKEKEMCKFFTRKFLLDRRFKFLPNDELTLFCEIVYYTGKSSKIQETKQELPIATKENSHCNPSAEQSASSLASENIKCRNNSKEKLSSLSNALDVFEAFHSYQLLKDVKLKTVTESFSTQKTVISARSMLSHDTKEKKTYSIEVDDSEDNIARALLLFLYSDSLKDLQWESALQIYHDAEKYGVKSLKILCSSFLVDNLSTSNASQLLLLADRHKDDQLKVIVENFILKHDMKVFKSNEWIKFSETNSQLAKKIMQLKHKREK